MIDAFYLPTMQRLCYNLVTHTNTDLSFPVALDELDFSSLEPMMMAKDLSGPDTFTVPDNVSCPPLLDGTESEEHVNELLSNGLRDIGYTDFRPGQVISNFFSVFY